MNDNLEILKTIVRFIIGAAFVALIVLALIQACFPGYKEPKINKVELGVRLNLYSDTTKLCYKDGPYYTAIRNDSSEVNGFTPCFRCGSQYGEHRSSLDWAMKEAAANNY